MNFKPKPITMFIIFCDFKRETQNFQSRAFASGRILTTRAFQGPTFSQGNPKKERREEEEKKNTRTNV